MYSRFAVFLILVGIGLAPLQSQTHSDVLREGVSHVDVGGTPGPLLVFGRTAFLVGSASDSGHRLPLVAGAVYGRGRVVAFGHDGFLSTGSVGMADTGRLVLNALKWCGAGKAGAIGLFNKGDRLKEFMDQNKVATKSMRKLDFSGVSVMVVSSHGLKDDEIAALQRFVHDGGGLLVGGLGWGWKQVNRGKDLKMDHPGNKLLVSMGLAICDGTLSRDSGKGFDFSRDPGVYEHALPCLSAAMTQAGSQPVIKRSDLGQVSRMLMLAIQNLPPYDRTFFPNLQKLAALGARKGIPTQDTPVRESDIAARLAVVMNHNIISDLPAGKIRAHAAGESFPGEVPAKANRVTREVEINTSVHGWHSTGLYAAAGDLVEVSLVSGTVPKGTRIRIGCHSDRIWHKDIFRRWPEISNSFEMTGNRTEVANAFGGLLYVQLPNNPPATTFKLRFRNAVEAPYYVHGETSVQDWVKTLRNAPAPWAEMECERVIISVPSSVVRKLDRPDQLMDVWTAILDHCADLASIPRERKRPERMVPDIQISAGYMHSGYPIMTQMDQIRNFVDVNHLTKEGNWGFFHELGHNHQRPEWTFSGTTEVTCNLFSLYCYEKLCGVPPTRHKRSDAEAMAKQFGGYDFSKPDWSAWKSKPFLALAMYVQLQNEFGWEPFKKIFADYQALPGDEKPKSDADRMDQWLIRFSNEVGRDLGPFFQTWGMPLSNEAIQQVKGKPVWMPANFPPKG